MSPDEWIGIVRWLGERNVRWTVDIAAKYGVKLKAYEAEEVRRVMARLLSLGVQITAERVVTELRRKPSKFTALIEKSHRRIYPNGCESAWCDICATLDNPSRIRHNA